MAADSVEPQLVLPTPQSDHPVAIHHLSHDLRGPLNSILGFAELLLDGIEGPLNEIQQEDIAAMEQSARNLLRLINTVVDLSKLEADRLNFDYEAVALEPALAELQETELAAAVEGGVRIEAEWPAALPPVGGDPERIQQMILEPLRFLIELNRTAQIHLTATTEAKTVTLRLSAGEALLPPEQVAELFALSVTVDEAGGSQLSRGGLGLPLAHRLAQAQQGDLWAEHEPQNSPIFYLKLPTYTKEQ